ncbi:metalloregulator ArsR/SmtB family transcription factor [Clostridium sp. 1001271B_151109_B4]|uniref:ArsR/SmtB family transcription factor n=1 Tax=Clostridium sp. 1001271B_151109_B4 TaxID=2787148 RepID=UPI0018AB5614|nr:metalloregulator ArsR/SmtB family transcription factor [Clostridium sp. 1001271B_151109_B4]
MESKYVANSKVFKAFCDENRLVILEILQSGEKCGCHLLERMSIGQSTLSHHMKILCESGVVKNRKDGKWTYYSINDKGCEYAMELLKLLTKVYSNENVDNSKCKN